MGELTQGTKLTHDFTVQYGKPSLVVQLDAAEIIKPEHVVRWINAQYIYVLNIAGPWSAFSIACPVLNIPISFF